MRRTGVYNEENWAFMKSEEDWGVHNEHPDIGYGEV